MVGGRQRAQNTVGERQEKRARRRERKKKTQEKKDARVSGEEFEEGNMRLVLTFAYNAVKSGMSQTTSV